MRICDLEHSHSCDLLQIDAVVWTPRHGIVSDLENKAVGPVKVRRELFVPIVLQLMATRLWQTVEVGKVRRRGELFKPEEQFGRSLFPELPDS